MRNIVIIILLIISSFGVSSCEMIGGWFDVDFETTMSGDLNIVVEESAKKANNEYWFQSLVTLNPLDDEQIAEYKDNIKEIVVTKIYAEVLEMNKDSVKFREGTIFSIVNSGVFTEWTLGNDWNIVDTTEIRLVDLDGAYGEVENILEFQDEYDIGVTGVCSESGVSMTIRVNIQTKIAAKKL